MYDPDDLGLNPNSGSHLLGDFGKVLNHLSLSFLS